VCGPGILGLYRGQGRMGLGRGRVELTFWIFGYLAIVFLGSWIVQWIAFLAMQGYCRLNLVLVKCSGA